MRALREFIVGGLSRWRYRLEKGQPHLIVFVMLCLVMGLMVVTGGLVLWVGGASSDPWTGMWDVFLHLSDPGYLGADEGTVGILVGTFMTVAGIVVFTSGIIAVVTTFLSEFLEDLARGGHAVAFHDHIVVIGWSEKVFSLVRELLSADGDNEIAILAPLSKADAERLLESRVFLPLERRRRQKLGQRLAVWKDPRRSVVYREGSPMIEADLDRVGTAQANRFILLSPDDGQGLADDVQMLREYLTVRNHRLRGAREQGDPRRPFACVVEITENRLREHVFLAAGQDPRQDAWVAQAIERDPARHLAVPDLPPRSADLVDVLTLINSDELITRALVQCAVQPRISGVYDVLLSFEGRDLTVVSPVQLADSLQRGGRAAWDGLVAQLSGDALPDGLVIAELARYLDNGQVLGALEPQEEGAARVLFDPADWRHRVPTGDPARDAAEGRLSLIVIADSVRTRGARRSPLSFRAAPHPAPRVQDARDRTTSGPPGHYRVLVLGSNRRLGTLIEQFAEYTEQYEHLDLALTIVDPELPDDLTQLLRLRTAEPFCVDSIRRQRADFSQWEVMRDLLQEGPEGGPAFDSVVLLAEDWDDDDVGVDARVVLGLVMLRAFRSDPRWAPRLAGTSVVAEILDGQNRALFEHEDWVTDVIVSNQYVSRFTAQVAHDVRVEELYRELFDFGGAEIYIRPLSHYVGEAPAGGWRWIDVVAAAGARREVGLGFLVAHPGDRVEAVVAPDGDRVVAGLEGGDVIGVLVLAED